MSPKIKKAARRTAFVYVSLLALSAGMLRAAQQTRRTLYGGQPVLARVTQAQDGGLQLELGGGEWSVGYPTEPPAVLHRIAALAEQLPPCTVKILLRLWFLAGQTARDTSGGKLTESSIRSR